MTSIRSAVLVIALATALPPQLPNPVTNFDVQKLADNVYAVIRKDPPGLMVDANNVFIIKEESVIVVDANGAPAIVPGHGPVLHEDRYLATLAAMLASIRRQAGDVSARGETLEQARKTVASIRSGNSWSGSHGSEDCCLRTMLRHRRSVLHSERRPLSKPGATFEEAPAEGDL